MGILIKSICSLKRQLCLLCCFYLLEQSLSLHLRPLLSLLQFSSRVSIEESGSTLRLRFASQMSERPRYLQPSSTEKWLPSTGIEYEKLLKRSANKKKKSTCFSSHQSFTTASDLLRMGAFWSISSVNRFEHSGDDFCFCWKKQLFSFTVHFHYFCLSFRKVLRRILSALIAGRLGTGPFALELNNTGFFLAFWTHQSRLITPEKLNWLF